MESDRASTLRSANDVASLIAESIRPTSRQAAVLPGQNGALGGKRRLTFMEIDEAFEYGRLKQRYLLRGDGNISEAEGDVLHIDPDGTEWQKISYEKDILNCLEKWDGLKEGAYIGLFLRNLKMFTTSFSVITRLAEVLQVPWRFITPVLLRQPSGNIVYARRNVDGEEELVSFSTSKYLQPSSGVISECLIKNLSQKTTAYISINYPEAILNDFRKLLDADASASSPELLTFLPQCLLARSTMQDLEMSRQHASRLLSSYEADYGSEISDQHFPLITEKTHHFFWELHRTVARGRRYTEYLKLLVSTIRLLNRLANPPPASTLASEYDLRTSPVTDSANFDTQASPYVARLITESEVLTSLLDTYIRRTKILINQIFHYSAQKDRQLNARMAEQSAQIAIDTRQDSYAMRTISILTMLFLPGTFISALFGMNFFNQPPEQEQGNGRNGGGLSAGSNLWLYFVLTIPLTALVFGLWFWWLNRGIRKAGRAGLTESERSFELNLRSARDSQVS